MLAKHSFVNKLNNFANIDCQLKQMPYWLLYFQQIQHYYLVLCNIVMTICFCFALMIVHSFQRKLATTRAVTLQN